MNDRAGDNPVRVRPMALADIPQVLAVDRISFTLPWSESAYRFELNENELSWLWVAEEEPAEGTRRITGIIVLWLIVDEAHIATIAVHPDYRGRGIGRALLVEALVKAIQQGASTATLEVRESNLAAQHLYRRFGFEVVGRRPRYYRDNQEDALIMTVSRLDEPYLRWLESGASTPAGGTKEGSAG